MSKNYIFTYDKNFPGVARKAIEHTSIDGKLAIASVFSSDSDFRKYASLNTFVEHFFANTLEYPTLFHYTDLNGLKGILQSHQILITSQYYMNDPKENVFVTELALDYLKLDNRLNENDLANFERSFHQAIFDIYVWSFTNSNHSPALANPEYGDFALEFKNKELQSDMGNDLNNRHQDLYKLPYEDNLVFPLKVEYNLENQKKYIEPIMKTWKHAYLSYKNDKYNLGMDKIMIACYKALTLCSLCFKSSDWQEEKEIRFVVWRTSKVLNSCHPDLMIKNKPKIIYKFNPKMLKGITCNNKVIDKSKIRRLLIENGFYNVGITE